MATYVNCGDGTYLNARTKASTSASVKYYIPHGEQVTVSSTSGTWSYVSVVGYSGKGSAWVQSSYLSTTDPKAVHDTQSSALGNKTLQNGRFGRYTYNLQIGLGISADGLFGNGTETAVKNFQTDQGLTADGLAGTNTLTKLWGAAKETIKSKGK